MTATNGIGYDIQVYSDEHGWRVENTIPFPDERSATQELSRIPVDGNLRRVYEALDLPPRFLPKPARS